MPRTGFARARLPNCTEFSGQKEIPDSVKSRKEKFFKHSQLQLQVRRYRKGRRRGVKYLTSSIGQATAPSH